MDFRNAGEDQLDADPLDDGLDLPVEWLRRAAVGLLVGSMLGLVALALCGNDICKWIM